MPFGRPLLLFSHRIRHSPKPYLPPMKLLILDNYDSFTYNLVQYFQELLSENRVYVFRNDEIDPVEAAAFDALVFSPGPGLPAQAGCMPEIIRRFAEEKPMLGICLGHQALAEAFGARLFNLSTVWHGRASEIFPSPEEKLFAGLPIPFQAGRYHSWAIEESSLPEVLQVNARDAAGTIMAIRHRYLPLQGLQFHPESILTPHGKLLLSNWITSLKGSRFSQPASHACRPQTALRKRR